MSARASQELEPPQPLRFSLRVQAKRGAALMQEAEVGTHTNTHERARAHVYVPHTHNTLVQETEVGTLPHTLAHTPDTCRLALTGTRTHKQTHTAPSTCVCVCVWQVRVDVRKAVPGEPGETGDLLAVWSFERFQDRSIMIREIYANVSV